MKTKTVLLVLSAKVDGTQISPRYKGRIDAAINYYHGNKDKSEFVFILCGRWGNVLEEYSKTESQVGKEYLLTQIPNAEIIKEDISVDTMGNFAFSKGIIKSLNPDKVVICMSDLYQSRVHFLTQKVFGNEFNIEKIFVKDKWNQPDFFAKEEKAIKLMKNLLSDVQDGDDSAVRTALLYKTPYYFKGFINDKEYFDNYWEGGFEDYLAFRQAKNSAK